MSYRFSVWPAAGGTLGGVLTCTWVGFRTSSVDILLAICRTECGLSRLGKSVGPPGVSFGHDCFVVSCRADEACRGLAAPSFRLWVRGTVSRPQTRADLICPVKIARTCQDTDVCLEVSQRTNGKKCTLGPRGVFVQVVAGSTPRRILSTGSFCFLRSAQHYSVEPSPC